MAETEEPPSVVQARIFNAAERALAIVRDMVPESERLAVIAAMQALQISVEAKSAPALEQAMAYVATTVHTLLPEIRTAARAIRRNKQNPERGHADQNKPN